MKCCNSMLFRPEVIFFFSTGSASILSISIIMCSFEIYVYWGCPFDTIKNKTFLCHFHQQTIFCRFMRYLCVSSNSLDDSHFLWNWTYFVFHLLIHHVTSPRDGFFSTGSAFIWYISIIGCWVWFFNFMYIGCHFMRSFYVFSTDGKVCLFWSFP